MRSARAHEFIAFKVDHMSVDHGTADASVTQQLLNLKDVLRAVILHRGFPVAKRMETYLKQSLVVKLPCKSLSLIEAHSMRLEACVEHVLRSLGKRVKRAQSVGEMNLSICSC